MQPSPSSSLKRDLGLLDAVAVGWGAIVGAGIFVVTGVAAGIAGPAFLIGLVVASMVATANALSSARLAARFPKSGGTYEYGYELLNPWAGFAAGWTFLASKLAAGGAVALGFGSYVARLLPGTSPKLAGIAAVVLLTVANYFGIKKAGRLNLTIVAITLSSLVVFAVFGYSQIRPTNFQPTDPIRWNEVAQSAAIIFFAFTGYARVATLAEEVKDPKTTIPKAIIIAIASTTILYFLVASIALGILGAEDMARTASPLLFAANRLPNAWVAQVVAVGATTAMLGVLLSQILGVSRVMLAMARRGDLPDALKNVHPVYGAPDRAILVTGGIVMALALFGTLEWVVSSATFSILLYYGITNLAALRSPKPKKGIDLIPWFGLLTCIALAVSLDAKTLISGMTVLVIGVIGRYLACKLRKAGPPQAGR